MATIERVSGTAFVVAEFRAEENVEPAPLYRDSIVELFLNEDKQAGRQARGGRLPLVKDLVKIRTRYFDDTLEQHLLSNVRQVVILGFGLDTRAGPMPVPGVRYYEIDDAETLNVKRTRYDELASISI